MTRLREPRTLGQKVGSMRRFPDREASKAVAPKKSGPESESSIFTGRMWLQYDTTRELTNMLDFGKLSLSPG